MITRKMPDTDFIPHYDCLDLWNTANRSYFSWPHMIWFGGL